jgi:NhaP-type Na+/H+ or K+/H+ antiporter
MIWERDLFDRNHEVIISENCLIFLLLLFLCSLSQSYLQKYYYYIPSTAVTLLISMTVSGIIRLGSGLNPNHPSQFATPFIFGFSSHIFYFGLLPPILFYSGYSLKRKYFYENFDAILMLAFAGTIMTIIIMTMGISFYSESSSSSSSSATVVVMTNNKSSVDLSQLTLMDCLLLSTILSSTDPITTLAVFSNLSVHYQLYYLVFGESILNDAVSVTMYNTLINVMDNSSAKGLTSSVIGEITGEFLIVFLVSSVIGYGMGILVAFLLKKFPLKEQRRDNHPRDTRSEEKPVNNNEEEQSQVNNNININDLENPAEGRFSPSSQRRSKTPTTTTTSASFARTTEESGGILSTLTSITSSYSSLPNHSTAHSHSHSQSTVTLATHETSPNSSSSEENDFLSVLLLIFICYFAFFLSETFKFSGIVTIFFCGISTRRYVLKNMNHSVKDFFSQMMEIVANLMETSCFIIMGLSIFLIDFAAYRMWFIGFVIVLMVVGRMISVYFLLNLVSLVLSLFYFSYYSAP